MLDDFTPLAPEKLLEWILRELEEQDTVLGISRELFLPDLGGMPWSGERFGEKLDIPLGIAAGPHGQLARNLLSAWLCGARFLELKTVQVLDKLTIPRPCIDMADEGYNCEWSQELPIRHSLEQYAAAFLLIRILQHKFGVLKAKAPGFIMNMSIGYDYEGIMSENVQHFLDVMSDSRSYLEKMADSFRPLYPAIDEIPLPEALSRSVTLSTMHGCPPDEIEKIARYLLEERGLHTAVKLNPTLLGPEKLRTILNEKLGYPTEVPDEAFEHDPDFEAAGSFIAALKESAADRELQFTVKLTNTLECRNHRDVFPETSMYMSGRALHPLSINLAARLQRHFSGELDISFCGGATADNFSELVACGLDPVTVSSDLLKPGGYLRLRQYVTRLKEAMAGSDSLAALQGDGGAQLERLSAYAEKLVNDERWQKDPPGYPSIKTDRPLPMFDCIEAPCEATCPAGQKVPEYMHYTARGEYEQAMQRILVDNPLPTVTGMVCDHLCMQRCTRMNYEDALRIRDIKRFIAHKAGTCDFPAPPADIGRRVAIIGAGPAGLACAVALRLRGVAVDFYEAAADAGGMVMHAIPPFRLREEDFSTDMHRIMKLGVTIHYGHSVDAGEFKRLKSEYDALFVGTGAQADLLLNMPGRDRALAALPFLAGIRKGETGEIGPRVAIIGGGNSAMDAARAALRLAGPDADIHIVYRRRIADMPADHEELAAVRAENITIHELLSPLALKDAPNKEGEDGCLLLECQVMQLGRADASGRPRPLPVEGEVRELLFDTVITAIGQQVEGDLPLDETDNVYYGGDVSRGAASIIKAIADGQAAASRMAESWGLSAESKADRSDKELSFVRWQEKTGSREAATFPEEHFKAGLDRLAIEELSEEEARQEAGRCLLCDERCDVCVSVCPNRANIAVTINPKRYSLQRILEGDSEAVLEADNDFVIKQPHQVIHIPDFCNHCGNCTTFCPSAGEPWQDKPRIALSDQVFEEEDTVFRLFRDGEFFGIKASFDGRNESLLLQDEGYFYETPEALVRLAREDFSVQKVSFVQPATTEVRLQRAAVMAALLDTLKHSVLLQG